MDDILSRSWRRVAICGGALLLFGIIAAFWPGLTLMGLVIMFTAYALVGGFICITVAVQYRKSDESWWLLLLLGLLGMAAGIAAIMAPNLTALVLALVIGATALATGVINIAMAIRLRKVIRGEGLLFLTGFISVMFGVSVFLFPGTGALALAWLISIYAIITGSLLLMLAWRARSWKNDEEARQHEHDHGLPHGSS